MTKQRDLKRLVRDRQQRTGESYMAALRRVRGQRPNGIPVIELVDVTDVGAALGVKCRVMVLPELAERVDVTEMLLQLRTVLLTTTRDHAFSLMRSVVLCGERPFASMPTLQDVLRFSDRTRVGMGGICDSGRMLAFPVAGRGAGELAVFVLWLTPVTYIDIKPALIVTTAVNLSVDLPEYGVELMPFGYPLGAP